MHRRKLVEAGSSLQQQGLVGGRTMDYGPFGFIDRYDPLFAKWTGSGEHYGFLNQPQAFGLEQRA